MSQEKTGEKSNSHYNLKFPRLIKLEVVLKQRDQMIEDTNIEIKNLQKINRDQEREISMYHRGLGYEAKVIILFLKIPSQSQNRSIQQMKKLLP